MKNCYIQTCDSINVVHDVFKLLPMTSLGLTGSWVGDEKISMDHLVQ